jgi:hypothetical protein
MTVSRLPFANSQPVPTFKVAIGSPVQRIGRP